MGVALEEQGNVVFAVHYIVFNLLYKMEYFSFRSGYIELVTNLIKEHRPMMSQ